MKSKLHQSCIPLDSSANKSLDSFITSSSLYSTVSLHKRKKEIQCNNCASKVINFEKIWKTVHLLFYFLCFLFAFHFGLKRKKHKFIKHKMFTLKSSQWPSKQTTSSTNVTIPPVSCISFNFLKTKASKLKHNQKCQNGEPSHDYTNSQQTDQWQRKFTIIRWWAAMITTE